MKLQITHLTRYTYQEPVMDSINEVRLTPRSDDHQECSEHRILVKPEVPLFSYTDYFGNTVHHFTIPSPHHELTIESRSIVDTVETFKDMVHPIPYETETDILASDTFQNQYAEYLMETDFTRITPELRIFCAETVHTYKVKSIYHLLEQISNLLYSNLTYDTGATHVHTTVEETLRLKRGVCQDYAHLMIAICRLYNIPTRYVSGYQFIGDIHDDQTEEVQHASHAWIEAYVPIVGWIGFDPTNNGKINWRYVKIGHGRNYRDIVPVKGVYQGLGEQKLEVSVDVKVLMDDSKNKKII
ncbi:MULTISPECIES: transglutaminase family protein [Metabacillus]|uniref:Transglutaminase n=2 Tax=Metabacillus TaxID=2675233 RepID=A0A179SNZ6_9BACI|nr:MULTISPECIES: transglutaminase family protein [Metabacillus]OAS83191.1 transglutaminase [Metabacillus litoralis]QNF29697.1 transglutaminase family protein [Metabacillus sp. KUDC1714]